MSNEQFTPPPPPGTDQGPRVTKDDLRDTSRLRRVVQGRQIGGVAAGVARYFDVDPTVVRVIWAVSALFGVGILAYIALWVVVPEDGSADQPFGLDDRNRGILIAGIAVLAAIGLLGSSWGWIDFPWPLLVIGGVAAVVLSQRGRRGDAVAAPSAPRESDAPTPGQVWNGSAWVPADTPGTPLGYESFSGGGSWSDTSGGQGSWQYTTGAHGPGQYWMPPVSPNPLKKGPLLFWWTMLAVLVAMGCLLVAGVTSWSAYPATALGVVAAALLLGAFWGRAGGLILIGLLLVPMLGVARVGEVVDKESVVWRPLTAAAVQDEYHRDFGKVVLDLSQVSNPEDLADRNIKVSVDFGSLEVVLPSGSSWGAEASVDLGRLEMAGDQLSGPDLNSTQNNGLGSDPVPFSIDAQVDLGKLRLHTAEPTGDQQ